MAFYSSTIFSAAGYSKDASLWGSWGFGLVTLVFALPAVYSEHIISIVAEIRLTDLCTLAMDTFGRRNLLLLTFPNMAMCLLGAGLCFLLPVGDSARVPLIAFFLYLFSALYGPGEGIVLIYVLRKSTDCPPYRHWPDPVHLLLRSLPTLPSRDRRCFHHLRQQCHGQCTGFDVSLAS